MKKNNDIKLNNIKERLACEKLSHISHILEYKYSLHTECEINQKEYGIWIEHEGVPFNHVYDINELVEIDVDIETRILRRAFFLGFGMDEYKEY